MIHFFIEDFPGVEAVRVFTIKEEVPPWIRYVIKSDNDFILKYACHEYKEGIPDWHGGRSHKLIRAISLGK